MLRTVVNDIPKNLIWQGRRTEHNRILAQGLTMRLSNNFHVRLVELLTPRLGQLCRF